MPRILVRLLAFVLFLTAILLLAAGRWDWAMAWAYMGVCACVTVFGVLVVPLDPELVEERTQIKEGVKEWANASLSSAACCTPSLSLSSPGWMNAIGIRKPR